MATKRRDFLRAVAGAGLLLGLLSACSGPLSVESKWGEDVPRGQSFDNYQLLENGGLYWHLVDLIWIFLFPLLYLIT